MTVPTAMRLFPSARRALLALGLLLAAPFLAAAPVQAATPAESFVQDNINKGLMILNDKGLSKDQRQQQFEQFLFGLTDMHSLSWMHWAYIAAVPARPISTPLNPHSRIIFRPCFSPISIGTPGNP